MKKLLRLYGAFFKMDVRRLQMYRANLLASSFGYLIDSLATIFTVWLIVRQTGTIGGWNPASILALSTYALFLIVTWEFFFVNTLEIPTLINNGQLDIFLTRPVGDLYQFIIFELDEESVFEMVFSLILFIIAVAYAHVQVTWWSVVLLILGTVSAEMALEAIYLAICSTAFWFQSTTGLQHIVYDILQLTRYPLTLYPNPIKGALTLLPFGLYGFYPLDVFLFHSTNWPEVIYVLVAGPAFLWLAYQFVWRRGLKHYTSSAG
ncbi:ABC transporter permease [Levilactobacillus andaensis]|uniref:ABC transporter permease n=1 Tax=Levilactobacillus andaensis TaxID=2799570 RepID=UPI0019455CE3|nr:ABC-2 family transporter protein [Levilactobacillus andaensis]